MIPGIQPTWSADLGEPMPRDPDALPPRNAFELVMNGLYRLALAMGHGNMVFAIKAAILTGKLLIFCVSRCKKKSRPKSLCVSRLSSRRPVVLPIVSSRRLLLLLLAE